MPEPGDPIELAISPDGKRIALCSDERFSGPPGQALVSRRPAGAPPPSHPGAAAPRSGPAMCAVCLTPGGTNTNEPEPPTISRSANTKVICRQSVTVTTNSLSNTRVQVTASLVALVAFFAMVRPVLASDTEREACAARLRGAAAEGRLNVTELDERLGAAYRARTQLNLAELTADLPEPLAARAPTPVPRSPTVLRRCLVALGAANATLHGLWVADVGPLRDVVILGIDQFDLPWPAIPLAAWSPVAAGVWHRRHTGQTTPDGPIPIG